MKLKSIFTKGLLTILSITLFSGCAGAPAASGGGDKKESADGSVKTETAAGKSGEEEQVFSAGVLSYLNIDEGSFADIMQARIVIGRKLEEEGFSTSVYSMNTPRLKSVPVYYDRLDAMLMGLSAGEIDAFEINQSTAQYICAANEGFVEGNTFDLEKDRTTFADVALGGIFNNDFSFMLLEGNEDLRDSFNRALVDMRNDGTLQRLVEEEIRGVIGGGEPVPIEMEKIEGADTIKIAVTGALPPMDYVDAAGNPAGFNTAVLSELGRRLGKNIEIVVVDSVGRATALSSGAVDVVFWTRTNSYYKEAAERTEEDNEAILEEIVADMTEEEAEVFEQFNSMVNLENYAKIDRPDHTIITDPYYSDATVFVVTRETAERMSGQ